MASGKINEIETQTTPSRVAIDVSNVSHSFALPDSREMQALASVSLAVQPGEMVCLLGPSGCGKSTLLNIIGGLVSPTQGRVTITGQPVSGVRPKEITFIFQDSALLPWTTIQKNVEIALEFQDVPRRERPAKAAAALKTVGMSAFADHYPGQISGGMKQRVALARSLSLHTPILLMDEPFGALDEQTRMLLGEDLSMMLGRSGKTIVLVTHSLTEAVFLSDRIFVMTSRPGRIKKVIEVGEPHPRQASFMTTPKFHSLRDELFVLLRDEIRRADAAPE